MDELTTAAQSGHSVKGLISAVDSVIDNCNHKQMGAIPDLLVHSPPSVLFL